MNNSPKNASNDTGIIFLKLSYYIASFFCAADSGFIFSLIIKNNISSFLGNTASNIIAGLFTICFILAVEGVLLFNLSARFRELLSKKVDGKDILWRGLMAYLLFLSVITAATSIYGRDYAAESIVPAPTLPDVAVRTNAATASLSANVESLRIQLTDLEKQAKTAKANAGSAQLRSLASSGNAWANTELSRLQSKAVAPYNAQIAETNNNLNAASAAITNTVNSITTASAAESTTLLNSYEVAKATVSGAVKYIVIIGLIIMWVVSLLTAKYDAADGKLDGVFGSKNTNNGNSNNTNNGNNANTNKGHQRSNKSTHTTPVVTYFETEAPISQTAASAETIVITTGAENNGNYNDNVTLGFEIDGFKFYQADNDHIKKVITPSGKVLDKTSCRQYINNYSRKQSEAVGTATKERLGKLVESFSSAMEQIEWPQ